MDKVEELQQIYAYFPNLSETQKGQYAQLAPLYEEWNAKINVVSRKDIDHLYLHHVLHSLAIAKVIRFRESTQILDLGTGGGFPAIPLAILLPECHFHLIDSIGKKIKVATAVAESIGLKNVTLAHCNGMEEKGKYDFVVSRAVMNTIDLLKIIKKNIAKTQHNSLPNGLICLKGGNLEGENFQVRHKVVEWELSQFFKDEYFDEKKVVFVPING